MNREFFKKCPSILLEFQKLYDTNMIDACSRMQFAWPIYQRAYQKNLSFGWARTDDAYPVRVCRTEGLYARGEIPKKRGSPSSRPSLELIGDL